MAAVLATGLLLSACTGGAGGAGSSGTTGSMGGGSSAPTVAAGTLTGVVHGGQSPIAGATVTLYEAAAAGGTATVLSTTQTNSNGGYSFAGVTSACSSTSSLLYVVASGGSAGGGAANSAINLMAAAGACGGLPSYVVINELTTVAAAYALDGFITVGSGSSGGSGSVSGCVDCTAAVAASSVNVAGGTPGLPDAFNTAALLADVTTGNAPSATGLALPPSSECTGGAGPVNCAALETLTGLANALGACVNSTSAGSECQQLFECAVPNATYQAGPPQSCTPPDEATLPADTLAATLLVARNPGLVSTQGLVSVAGEQVLFAPGLLAAPNDWTIALSIAIAPNETPGPIAIDAQGDVWFAALQGISITELSSSGATLGTFSGGGYAQGIAIDGSGNVWVAQSSDAGITEIPGATSATPGTPTQIDTGNNFRGIAADPSGNIWAANTANDTLTEIDPATGAVTGFTGGGVGPDSFVAPYGIAIDASSDVWVTAPSYGQAGAIAEFSSEGVPSADSPISGGGVNFPEGIAIDPSGDVWVVDDGTSAVTKLEPNGTQLWTSPGMEDGMEYPVAIAIDAAGTGWVSGSSGISALSSGGTLLTPNSALTGGEIRGANQVAVDPSGDVWVTDSNGNLVTEFIGAAAPTVTPLVAQLTVTVSPGSLACYAAPASPGGVEPWENQSYCATLSGMTMADYTFTGTLTFTTNGSGDITACQYATSGTYGGSPASTGPSTCIGVGSISEGGDFELEDSQDSLITFSGTIASNGQTLSGTCSSNPSFGPGSGDNYIISCSISGSIVSSQ